MDLDINTACVIVCLKRVEKSDEVYDLTLGARKNGIDEILQEEMMKIVSNG